MKKIAILICLAIFATALSSCGELKNETKQTLPSSDIIQPESDDGERWYDEKLEKVIEVHKEVEFVYGKILSVKKTEEGQTGIVICANSDMDINHRKNYFFVIRDNAYLRYGNSDYSKDDLSVGQKVFISFASAFEDTLEYAGNEHGVEMFSLFVLDDDAKKPEPLTPQDYQYYDYEIEVEVEPNGGDYVLE